jgi:hypothetical protein
LILLVSNYELDEIEANKLIPIEISVENDIDNSCPSDWENLNNTWSYWRLTMIMSPSENPIATVFITGL